MRHGLRLAIAAAAVALASSCGSDSPSDSTPSSSEPRPQDTFLEGLQDARIAVPDDEAVELAKQHCTKLENDSRYSYSRSLQVSQMVLGADIPKADAKDFLYEAESAFCPDQMGGSR